MKNGGHLDELFEFLRIASVSGETEHEADIGLAVEWLVAKLSGLGFEARAMETSYNPVVYGENLQAGADKPTVLVYGHYDVQSPEPLGEWKTEPFEPVIKNGNIYGRGTADNKGQIYTWIAAIEDLIGEDGKLPVNVKFLIEGAEEQGSEGLGVFVSKNKKLLEADTCVISDSHSLSETQPLITYGLRGLCYMEIVIRALSHDVHSGLYGGNVTNPALVLARILENLKSEDHVVAIPGFYDQVRELTSEEKQELAEFPFGEGEVVGETGVRAVAGVKGQSVAERAGAQPTLDVNGMVSGYVGEGAKTIIPAEARAKVSMRLVPNQDSEDIEAKFREYVLSLVPPEVELEMIKHHGAEPVLLERKNRFFVAAENAMKETFGNMPLYELSGGSIGVVVDFKEVLGLDSVLMGYGLPDDGLHAPNEKLSARMFEKGILTNKVFLRSLG